jgi:hypothetical protein
MNRAFLAAAIVLPAFAANDAGEILRQIERSKRELTEITGLAWKHAVKYEVIDRKRVEKFMRDRMKEAVKPPEIRAEEITLKKFGFVPADFDLARSTVDLLTEQAAAFYDFHKKKLFLTDWASSEMQDSALVHELAHALADQYFNLGRFIEQAGKSDDSALARMAVMEGQASWLMTEVLARRRGQSLIGHPELAEAMSRPSETGNASFPVFNTVPLYLRETLVFPYTAGLRFQDAVAARSGREAFAQVFRKPPVSSRQILHPSEYFSGAGPVAVEAPAPPSTRGLKRLSEGMLGELDFAILIEEHVGKGAAGELSPHWRGGAYAVWESKDKTRSVLSYAVVWDSDEIARRYFDLYAAIQAKKWKKREVSSESPGEVRGTGDDGRFVVKAAGRTVTVIEGLEEPAGALVRKDRKALEKNLNRKVNSGSLALGQY